jgi:hypothetical protein
LVGFKYRPQRQRVNAIGAHMLKTVALINLLELSGNREPGGLNELVRASGTEVPADAVARLCWPDFVRSAATPARARRGRTGPASVGWGH